MNRSLTPPPQARSRGGSPLIATSQWLTPATTLGVLSQSSARSNSYNELNRLPQQVLRNSGNMQPSNQDFRSNPSQTVQHSPGHRLSHEEIIGLYNANMRPFFNPFTPALAPFPVQVMHRGVMHHALRPTMPHARSANNLQLPRPQSLPPSPSRPPSDNLIDLETTQTRSIATFDDFEPVFNSTLSFDTDSQNTFQLLESVFQPPVESAAAPLPPRAPSPPRSPPPSVPPRSQNTTTSPEDGKRPRPPPPDIPERPHSGAGQVWDDDYDVLQAMVLAIRREIPIGSSIPWSPSCRPVSYSKDTRLDVSVTTSMVPAPVCMKCEVGDTVNHIISLVLASCDETLNENIADDYYLQLKSSGEYLRREKRMCELLCTVNCIRSSQTLQVALVSINDVKKTTSSADSGSENFMDPRLDCAFAQHDRNSYFQDLVGKIKQHMDLMREAILQNHTEQIRTSSCQLKQFVKLICTLLGDLTVKSVTDLMPSLDEASQKGAVSTIGPSASTNVEQGLIRTLALNQLELVFDQILLEVDHLRSMYFTLYRIPFKKKHVPKETKTINHCKEALLIHIKSIHRLPRTWSQMDRFEVVIKVAYGETKFDSSSSQTASISSSSFGQNRAPIGADRIIFDEMLQFDKQVLCLLPRETSLQFAVYAIPKDSKILADRTRIGTANLHLFNSNNHLGQGDYLLPLWTEIEFDEGWSDQNDIFNEKAPLLLVHLPEFPVDIVFHTPVKQDDSPRGPLTTLAPETQEELEKLLKNPSKLTRDDLDLIWEKRSYLENSPDALPLVLQAAHGWNWLCLPDLYYLVDHWRPLYIDAALELLLPRYCDEYVRAKAVQWLSDAPVDEIMTYLPQMTQALKFDRCSNSALARFLLEQGRRSARFGQSLYWHLRECERNSPMVKRRYQLLIRALLTTIGPKLAMELKRQHDFVEILSGVATALKDVKPSSRPRVLEEKLGEVRNFFENGPISLPLPSRVEVRQIYIESCSFFNSFTVPLKLAFHAMNGSTVSVMFKAGDDLRQDMLCMQFFSLIDRLWLQEGLDLKTVTFLIQETGEKEGLVELVEDSKTLREIQVHYDGLTGSFNPKAIADWLRRHNPDEKNYQKAVDRFTTSCAGSCVLTYILGVGDRHNDNIMLMPDGRMFHIDFGKFLGDSQTFGSFKRDRTPFVFTPDMAYVINGGKEQTNRYQDFVDLCCNAFNVVRHHSSLLLNTVHLMCWSGIPNVTPNALSYIQNALLPSKTDTQATEMFTKMLDTCQQSTWNQINFLIHNIAQRHANPMRDLYFSFVAKNSTKETDGRIMEVKVEAYMKSHEPCRTYMIRLIRDDPKKSQIVFRKYSELEELSRAVYKKFPLGPMPQLPPKSILRNDPKKEDADKYLHELFALSPEVSESDLLYTFFQTLPRDSANSSDEAASAVVRVIEPVAHGLYSGQVKLKLSYKNMTFNVFVMHARDLHTENSSEPSAYTKLYLLPDPSRVTKKKTKIVPSSSNPTFNQILSYEHTSLEKLKTLVLQVTMWSYDRWKENEYLGGVSISLANLRDEATITDWYKLGPVNDSTTKPVFENE